MENNRYLVQLQNLVNALHSSEVRLARKHILAYESNHTLKHRKMFVLYQLICRKGMYDYSKIKQKVSPESNAESFNRLIKRTINRVYESLLLDVNIKRKDSYNELFRVQIDVRKQLIRAQILLNKGLVDQSKASLKLIRRTTKTYELYDELVECLFLMRRIYGNTKELDKFKKLENEIKRYEQSRNLLLESRSLYQSIKASLSASLEKSEYRKDIFSEIHQLKEYFDATGSYKILSYYLLLMMEFHYANNQFKAEVETGLNFISHLKKQKSIFSKIRITIIYSSLSNTLIGACDFLSTYKFAEASEIWSMKNPNLNHLIALEQKTKALIFLGEYEKALNEIDHILKHELISKYPFQKTKADYYSAVIAFLLEDFRFASRKVYDLGFIEKDREGWNLWIRLLRVMISLEREDLSTVDYELESFRKYLSRTGIDKSSRIQLILNLLRQLERNDLNYQSTWKKNSFNIQLLASLGKPYQWDSTTAEMVLFHEWFEAKAQKRKYNPSFKKYKIDLLPEDFELEKV